MTERHPQDTEQARTLRASYEALRREIATVIVGQDDAVEQLLIALLARGHCLLVGVPGLAKTLLIRTLAQVLELKFSRIQFTPDLMPSDITGTEIIEEQAGRGPRRSSSSRVRSSPTSSSPTKSTARRPRRRPRCSKPCRNTA